MTRTSIVEFCKSKGITLNAWASLARGLKFDHPEIVRLSKKYDKTPAQVMIRYGLEKVRWGGGPRSPFPLPSWIVEMISGDYY
jgi:diketogulonate reductase-like aldo/keto reductase